MTLEKKVIHDGNVKTEVKGNFENGKLNGEGEIIHYDVKGNKWTECRGNFEDGVLNGTGEVIIYYGNGNMEEEHRGNFKDGFLNDGDLIHYDRDGNVTRREERRS